MKKTNESNLNKDTTTAHVANRAVPVPFGYKTNKKAEVMEVKDGSDLLQAFCELVQPSTPEDSGFVRKSFWSANTVQREIRNLINSPTFHKSPHSAYLEVYANMTAARDLARCTKGDPMYPTNKLDRRLNDALSDLMTRNYLEIVRSSVNEPDKTISSAVDLGGNFQLMHKTAEKQNWNAVRVALGSTGLYLTQHLSLALSALPHLDELWEGTPYKDISSRTQRMKDFKRNYDAFNSFLGKNLVTVAQALHTAELTRGDSLEKVTRLAQPILPTHLFFGVLRDKAFNLGLSIATHTPQGQHPWTFCDKDGRNKMASQVLNAPTFPKNHKLQRDLSQLQRFSLETSLSLANPLSEIFQGKKYRSSEILEISPM